MTLRPPRVRFVDHDRIGVPGIVGPSMPSIEFPTRGVRITASPLNRRPRRRDVLVPSRIGRPRPTLEVLAHSGDPGFGWCVACMVRRPHPESPLRIPADDRLVVLAEFILQRGPMVQRGGGLCSTLQSSQKRDDLADSFGGEVRRLAWIRGEIEEQGVSPLDPDGLEIAVPNRRDRTASPVQSSTRGFGPGLGEPRTEIDSVEVLEVGAGPGQDHGIEIEHAERGVGATVHPAGLAVMAGTRRPPRSATPSSWVDR